MPHHILYMIACLAATVSAAWVETVDAAMILLGCGVLIACVGVPHGGLDHWTGRRWLHGRWGQLWPAIFFPGYLLVATLVVAGWVLAPVMTVIGFFVVSAWHFGREDQFVDASQGTPWNHLLATAMGGTVIWVAALVRGSEMQAILQHLLWQPGADDAALIVEAVQILGIGLLAIAGIGLTRRWILTEKCDSAAPQLGDPIRLTTVMFSTALVTAVLPILVSFTLYFCGWHSIVGLRRLRRESELSWPHFYVAVAPLSLLSIAGVMLAGWWLQTGTLSSAESTSLRMVFIGLSAIAVPHLLLHEWDAGRGTSPLAEPRKPVSSVASELSWESTA